MSEYRIKISGVHYGANGDSVAGQKETAEMTARTLDLLRWVDRERQIVTLAPDPANPIHKDAIKARSRGRKIGRVAKEDVKNTWDLLRQSGKPMLMARVSEVVIKEHGYIVVTVDADELQPTMPATSPEVEWQQWMSDLPLLPPSELLEKEDEAAFMLDSLYMSNLDGADTEDLKFYLDLWTEGSRHDLSYEACQKRSEYIRCLESAQDKDIRQLAEPLKEQGRRMCERAFLDEHATVWWAERMKSADVKELWQTWKLKNENMLWLGLRRIDTLLRQLPGELYKDIGHMDVVLSRLYYMDTPRKAFQSILALMMLRELTCRELGIEMRPMTEVEYQQDGRISNPMDMPTTIGRVVAFGETRCDRGQKQTIELLVHWLRDDYEQSHPQELEALAEDTQAKLAEAIEKAANKPTTQVSNTLELVGKKETNIDTNYGPNIENNGTLSLPEDFGAKTLSESDDDKQ
ncbi:MAG: hypothetical protein IJQ04_04660 [Prevotella sp.]|nr:hypothetical protein [Prevotella sp.]